MRRPVFFSRLLFALLLALSAFTAAQAQKPLKEADILKELAGGANNKRIAAEVRKSGVAFSLSPESEERLRALGADDELITAIRAAAAARTAAEEAPKPPLTESEILKGLAGRMSNQRLTELVGRYGVDFALTAESEERLRALGANDELITAIRNSKPKLKGPAPGTTKINPKDGLSYAWIPPGTFLMGCSPGDSECDGDEKPAHTVTLSKGFWMGQTEVTEAAFQRINGTNPSLFKGDRLPAENVTWEEASAYCTAVGMHLPTEAQWEYAARAGTTGPRYGELDAIAWFHKTSGGTQYDVGQKQPNAWKLYDTLGNVEEWTADFYDGSYYEHSPSVDPTGPSSGDRHAVREGSWYSGASGFRVSDRDNDTPTQRRPGYGFRCAGDLP